MKSLVLLSGGMDSATALGLAVKEYGHEVETISFNYGSKHNDREYEHAKALAEYYGVPNVRIDLDFVNKYFKSDLLKSGGDVPEGHYADESMKKTVVPFRNGIMLAISAGYAESRGLQRIILSNHAGDHAIYPDCRTEFTNPMAQAVLNGTYNEIEFHSPFGKVDKTEIARIGSKINVPYELTWSCYKGGEIHCGKCGTCVERIEAFVDSGVKDPTRYLINEDIA